MRLKSIGFFLGWLVSGGLCFGLELVPPSQIGLAREKLDAITHYLEGEVAAGHVAGAAGFIARHGQIGYFQAAGFSDIEAKRDMTSDTLFRIASMTKAITSVAVMMLVEEGDIALEDPIEKYLPDFRQARVLTDSGDLAEVRSPITIHHLLTHTSGIGYGWFGPEEQDIAYQEAGVSDVLIPADSTDGDWLLGLARLPLAFQPGEQWAYGLSLDVLGRVVESVSGLTLEQFFHARIFRPLKMTDTHFYVPEKKLDRLAALYTPDSDEGNLQRVGSEILEAGPIKFSADFCYDSEEIKKEFYGGSGLVSSTLDYARFLQMLLGGGRPLLQPATLEQMTRNQIGDLAIPFPGHGDGFGYGFGVLTERGMADDVTRVGTYSWGGIFNTYYWVDPQEEMIGILMTQVFPNDHLDIRREFKRLAYDALDDSGFFREYWYEKGAEHGNPFFNQRQLRVNAPEVSTHESFSQRSEARSSGLARILVEEDLRSIRRASLYGEVWGGHPGTANKRVNLNGRRQLFLPEVGTAAGHCTHHYPTFFLKPNDLVNGYNAIQFACDQGSTFWGHYIVDNVCLKIGLDPEKAGIEGFRATVVAEPDDKAERIALRLETEGGLEIASVHYQGRYHGYDENGNGRPTDWHGMTKERQAYGMLGDSEEVPFTLDWDTSMLPSQSDMAVKALVRFVERPGLVYETPVVDGLSLVDRPVTIHHADELPQPFWSRAARKKTAGIELDMEPDAIEKAELHIVTWTGGAGEVKDYFTLNGHPLPVAEGSDHEVNYVKIPVSREWLRKGSNEMVLLSDTQHHGIEVLLPGPALVVRKRSN